MIYTKPLKYDNCKDCIRTCEHAGKDREFCYSKDVSCKKTADKIDNIRKQAVKEFAGKLKAKYGKSCSEYYPMLIEMTSDDIDELLKECLND